MNQWDSVRQQAYRVLKYPLLWLAVMTVLQYAFGWSPPTLPFLVVIVFFGYIMNTTYAMQSRGATRNNNVYHLIGAVSSSFAFFIALQYLVLDRFMYGVLAPYVFATVLGTVHGTRVCLFIERVFHIYADDDEMKEYRKHEDPMKLWPTVAVLAAFLIGQFVFLAWHPIVALTRTGEPVPVTPGILMVLVALCVADGFAHTSLRTARSADNYWFHGALVLLLQMVSFAKIAWLVDLQVDWSLFIPVTTGQVTGALLGANFAAATVKRIGAKFDVHFLDGKELKSREAAGLIPWPTKQVALLSSLLIVQAVAIGRGYAALGVSVLIFVLTFGRDLSFTLKSRAGNRDDLLYLAWVSVLSNGVWFLAMNPLTAGDGLTLDKALPYIVGGGIGSLLGQLVAMKVEVVRGSRVDRLSSAPVRA